MLNYKFLVISNLVLAPPMLQYISVFRRGETRSLPSSVQATASMTSSSSHDNFLSEAFRSTPRPLPYDADPRYIRSLISRREKGSSHSHEEAEPLRSDSSDAADTESFSKWGNNKSIISDKDAKEEYSSKSGLRISKSKSVADTESIYVLSEDEDVCPTCLEGNNNNLNFLLLFFCEYSFIHRLVWFFLAEYTSENPKIVTKCCHHFHLGCIYEWMERSENCPVCGKVTIFLFSCSFKWLLLVLSA